MKKILLIILITLPALQGCHKFLDLQPKGFTIPGKYDDYVQIMNYAQLQKAADIYLCMLTDDALLTNGDSIASYRTSSEINQRLYSFAHGPVFNEGVQDYIWELGYNRIYSFNVVINHIMEVADAPESKKLTVKAEALFARAFEYFTMVTVYSKAYNASTAATDIGIPLMESEDVGNVQYNRNTVAEVYEKIEKDLDEALPNLLDAVPNSFRPSKTTAYAFRARIALYKREYDKALTNAKAAVALNTSLVDLNLYGIKPGNISIGRICKLPGLTEVYPEGISNPENIYARYLPAVFGVNETVYASDELLSIYAKDLASGQVDKRRTLWFADNQLNGRQFPGRSIYCPYIRSNVGLNNMEVMLTAAECYARAGGGANLTEAARLYNLLRKNRISNYVDVTFASPTDALNKILDERRREFAFLGVFRYTDLKRLNQEDAFKKTITHTADGQTWTLPPGDLRYVMPVPPKVKAFRPDLPDFER